MKLKLYSLFFLLLVFTTSSFCQSSDHEYFVTGNGNLYLPINTNQKGVYPILGYDKEAEPKLLIGGLGIGLSVFKPLKSKLDIKGQVNLSKHTYWDEPYTLLDENRTPTGFFLAGSSDFSIGLTATVHYFLTNNISIGTGLGGQILLVSLSRLPERDMSKGSVAVNRYYKPFMPTLPVEVSCKFQKTLYNIRYEHGLLNRIKGDLKEFKKDNFGLLTFEIGLKI